MSTIQPAIYARVSSEHQVKAHTIDSQVAALRDRVTEDGFELGQQMEFIDDGYIGSTLVRPALERLRDVLQGLILCKKCGYALSGRSLGKLHRYTYYRCLGTEPHRCGGYKVCDNNQIRTDLLDIAVWQEVTTLLEHPARMTEEYRRRLQPETKTNDGEIASVEARLSKLRHGLARLIDSYADGLIDKSEFEPRIKDIRQRSTKLEAQANELANQASLERDLRLVVSSLEQFTASVKGGLDQADWAAKRDIIRALVKRVEVEKGLVNVVFRVDPLPFDSGPARGLIMPHCWRGFTPAPVIAASLRESRRAGVNRPS